MLKVTEIMLFLKEMLWNSEYISEWGNINFYRCNMSMHTSTHTYTPTNMCHCHSYVHECMHANTNNCGGEEGRINIVLHYNNMVPWVWLNIQCSLITTVYKFQLGMKIFVFWICCWTFDGEEAEDKNLII